MTILYNSVLAALSEVADLPVELTDGPVPLGHFPLLHILALSIEKDGDIMDVVARLEADGWKPGEVMANAYPHLVDGEDQA